MSFPRYPKYKDSGVEWLGEVPEHWDVMALRRLAMRTQTGSTPPTAEAKYYEDGTIPWYGPASFDDRIEVSQAAKFLHASAVSDGAARVFAPGATLVITIGATIGKVSSLPHSASCNQQITAIEMDQRRVHPRFATYQLKRLEPSLRAIAPSATLPILDQGEISELRVCIPPIEEQSIVAEFLDRETGKIDELVAEQQRLMELLKEKRQAVISHAVTKGLNPRTPMKTSGIEWLGDVPAHWGTCQSRRMFAVRSEPALASDQMLTASQKYGVLLQSDFVELEGRRVVEVIMGKESLKHVEPDDFIISMRSFQGGIEWCKLRGSTSFHYVMLKPVKDVHPPFFAHLFKSATYIQALRTTTDLIRDGQELRFSNFAQVDLPVVPLEEQAMIATFLDREVAKLDALAAEAQKAIDLLQERRTALISAAVTGQIDVRKLAAA